MTLGLVFMEPLLKFLWVDTKGELVGYARDYFRIILYGLVFQQIGFGFSNCTRAQGFPMIQMISMVLGAGTNTILDPIFIFLFGWGVKGAAFATIISQTLSMVYVLAFAGSKKAVVRLRLFHFKPDWSMIRDIAAFGSSQFLMQIAMSCIQFVNNTCIRIYGADSLGVANGGDIALSAMNIVGSVVMLIMMPIFGINQGAQPVLGYNYGAKNWRRVRRAYAYAAIAATVVCTVGFTLLQFFATSVVHLFAPNGSAPLMRFTPFAMRMQILILPLVGAQIVGANMFVVTGRPKVSIVLSMLRQVIVLIPCIIIFGRLWGLFGIVFATPASDLVSVVITSFMVIREMGELKRNAIAKGEYQDSAG
jgi:Na+-driven multidrug efflux pump